jgi:hypothetical protein
MFVLLYLLQTAFTKGRIFRPFFVNLYPSSWQAHPRPRPFVEIRLAPFGQPHPAQLLFFLFCAM